MNYPLDIQTVSDIDLLRESVDLECKLALGQDGQGKLPKDFWPSYSAMANTDGGLILLGIEERKGRFSVRGIPNPDGIRKELADLLGNRQKVSINLLSDNSIQALEFEGKTVLFVEIPRASRKQRPVFINGNPLTGTYRRFHETDQEIPEDEIKLLLSEQQVESLDYRILPKFGMEDLSLPTLQAYRQTHATLNPGHRWSELSNNDFLREVRAWNRDRETGEEGLTVAGLLMFGKFQSIQDEFPHYALDYQERPEAKTEKRWVDRIWLDGSWSGNLYDFFRLVYPKLTTGLKIPFVLKGGLRNDDTPVHEALREALANTLIHADYRQRARVLVVKRPDMFGFQNPGDMRIPLEVAMRGDEPDSRNKRLAHLFGFVRIGEKAGTGIPKILSHWKSQHWRQPSLTEEHEPSPRTILRLQMLDLFPPGVLDLLKAGFKERFEALDANSRLALAVTLTERRLTHARLCELTELHPSDVTKILRGLVGQDFLMTEGAGRGTVYRFKGTEKISPDDVFEVESYPNLTQSSVNLTPSSVNLTPSSVNLTPSSVNLTPSSVNLTPSSVNLTPSSVNLTPSSPNLTPCSVNLIPSSPNLTPNSPNLTPNSPNLTPSSPNLTPEFSQRDESGRLLSGHFPLPFIDQLQNLTPELLERLTYMAAEPQKSGRVSRERMIEVLLSLCDGHYVRLDCLAKLVNRSPNTLQGQYLTRLCRDQRLRMAFQDNPTDPRQAYTKS